MQRGLHRGGWQGDVRVRRERWAPLQVMPRSGPLPADEFRQRPASRLGFAGSCGRWLGAAGTQSFGMAGTGRLFIPALFHT